MTSRKSIPVDDDVYTRLTEIKAHVIRKYRRNASWSDTVRFLLDFYDYISTKLKRIRSCENPEDVFEEFLQEVGRWV